MTLEEKVGQMIQPDLREVTPAEVTEYKLGSILVAGRSQVTINTRLRRIGLRLLDFLSGQRPAFDGPPVPFAWATDAVHGHNNVFGATLFRITLASAPPATPS